MDYIFIGPPGCGKGTQSEFLKADPRIEHISTGDLLRSCSIGDDDICKRINQALSGGKFIEDELVIELVQKKLANYPDKVIVFDGFPRTVGQANLLDDLLKQMGREIGKALYFEIPDSSLVERVVNRSMCPNCGHIYNNLTHPPKVAGVCDYCPDVELTRRKDDDAEILQERLKTYHELTEPLVRFYEARGELVRVDAQQSASDVREFIAKIVN